MNLKWFVPPVLALAVSVVSGGWAKSTYRQEVQAWGES